MSGGELVSNAVWLEAASFAARMHANQVRKDRVTPYVAHVYRVAMTVSLLFGCDDEVAVTAAILHDTIEDTPCDYDDIHHRFGVDVADCVAALTKNMALPEPQREPDYDRRLADACWQARLVKLADTLDNLVDCPTRPDARAGTRKTLEKARRAIALAQGDAPDHPAIARAIHLLREAMAREGPNARG